MDSPYYGWQSAEPEMIAINGVRVQSDGGMRGLLRKLLALLIAPGRRD
jgi:hypothetical protein